MFETSRSCCFITVQEGSQRTTTQKNAINNLRYMLCNIYSLSSITMSSSRVRVLVNATERKNDKEKIERFLCVFFVFVFCFFLILFLVFLFGKILSCVCVPFLKGRRICLFSQKSKILFSSSSDLCFFRQPTKKRGEESRKNASLLCCV